MEFDFRVLRILLGISREEFGRDLGITRVTIGNLENGKSKVTKTYKLAIKYLVDTGYYDQVPQARLRLVKDMLKDL